MCAPPPGRDRLVALYAYNFGNYRNEFGQYKGGAAVGLPDYRGWRNRFVFSDSPDIIAPAVPLGEIVILAR